MVHAMPEEQPWTIAALLEWTRQYFARKEIEKPRLDAEVLLAHVLGIERIALYTGFERVVKGDFLARYRECVKQRAEHCPVAYITGRKEFMSLTFEVSPDVLIPRPETELLVERALMARHEPSIIVEIGTGSGNIAVALAVKLPQAEIIATDISEAALRVARRNARLNGVDSKIRFIHGDMLAPVTAEGLTGRVDVLVSNPPYVAEEEWANLMSDVRDYEPRPALVSGKDPLKYYRVLARGAPEALSPGGRLMVEVGADRAEAVGKLFEDSGLRRIEYVKDYEGIDRVIEATAG